jgi:hypothetical protein
MYTGSRPISEPLENHFMVVDWQCRLPEYVYTTREEVEAAQKKIMEHRVLVAGLDPGR